MMSPQPTKTDIIQKQKDLIKQLSNENQSYFDEIEGLKRQVSRGEIFRLREKIRLIEQDNKSYVLKLTKSRDKWKAIAMEEGDEIDELKEEIRDLHSKARGRETFHKEAKIQLAALKIN
jgi:hypothetical protein